MIKDKQVKDKLMLDGYAVVGALDASGLSQLLHYHATRRSDDPQFYYSLLNNDYNSNKAILETQKEILAPFFEEHFSDYRTITESYLIKPPNTAQEFLLHQDWCYTDEDRYQAYNVWIPLSDVNEENGALFFLPGSHLWFDNKRSGSLHTGRIGSGSGSISKNIATVPLRKGEVVIFHPAVFHGSWPNASGKPRVVVTATVMDRDALFLYYQKADEKSADVYELEDERFIKDLVPLTRGEDPGPAPIDRIKYHHIIVTEEMILEKLAAVHQDQ